MTDRFPSDARNESGNTPPDGRVALLCERLLADDTKCISSIGCGSESGCAGQVAWQLAMAMTDQLSAKLPDAESVYETETNVLLIDADYGNASLSTKLNRPLPGFAEILSGEAELWDTLIPCDQLHFMPYGDVGRKLGSAAFAHFLKSVRLTFDFVVFCMPPSYAHLAAKTDGVVVVIESNVTTRNDTRRMKRLLQRQEARVLGAILHHHDRFSD